MTRIGFVQDPKFKGGILQLRFNRETQTLVRYDGGRNKVYLLKKDLPPEGFPEQIVLVYQPMPKTKWRKYTS